MKTPLVKFTALSTLSDQIVELSARPFTNLVLLAGPRNSGRSTTLSMAWRRLRGKYTVVPARETSATLLPLFTNPVAAGAPIVREKESLLLCDNLECSLPATKKHDMRERLASLELNLQQNGCLLIATTSSEFALQLLRSNSVPLDTAVIALPLLPVGVAQDFRKLLYTVREHNPGLFDENLFNEGEAMRLQVECIGLPGLLFRQLKHAEQIAVAKGRNVVKPPDLRQAALEAFKLRAIRTEFEELRLALDNSQAAFFSLSGEFGLKDEQLELALAH